MFMLYRMLIKKESEHLSGVYSQSMMRQQLPMLCMYLFGWFQINAKCQHVIYLNGHANWRCFTFDISANKIIYAVVLVVFFSCHECSSIVHLCLISDENLHFVFLEWQANVNPKIIST